MSCHPDAHQHDLRALAAEAERLQTQVNEFIGRATMVRVDLPAALYDANAQLLLVPGMLRELAERRQAIHAARAGRGS
jgi:class 3 adenylate cyclase